MPGRPRLQCAPGGPAGSQPTATATEPELHVEAPAALGDMAPAPSQSVAAAFARQPHASGDKTQPRCVDLL